MRRGFHIDKLNDECGQYTLAPRCSERGHERTADPHAMGPRTVRKLELRANGAISEHRIMFWRPTNFLALLVASMANWLGRHAATQMDYLKAENRALRTRLAGRRIVFTDAERPTLGTLAKRIGIKALRELDPSVSP
jgi:hypothetical protein